MQPIVSSEFIFVQKMFDLTDATLSEPRFAGSTMTVVASNISIDPEHPANRTGTSLSNCSGEFVFRGVALSKRTMQRQTLAGDTQSSLFEPAREVVDYSQPPQPDRRLQTFYLEGIVTANQGALDVADPWEILCESASFRLDVPRR